MDSKYKYGDKFQRQVISLCISDPKFLNDFNDVVHPEYFTSEYRIIISSLVKQYYERYRVSPGKSNTESLLRDYLSRYKFDKVISDELYQEFVSINAADIGNSYEFLRDKVVEFGQWMSVRNGVDQINDILRSGDPGKLRDCELIMRKALTTGSGSYDLGLDIVDVVNKGQISDLVARSSFNPHRQVPTGINTLDRCLMGGVGFGEIALAIGSQKVGKTTFAVNLLASAAIDRKAALYLSFETKRDPIALRVISRLTGIPVARMLSGIDSNEVIEAMSQYVGSYIKVQYFNPNTLTASQLRSYLTKVQDRDEIDIKLLILDYSARMYQKTFDTYNEQRRLYEDIVGIASDFDMAIWDFAQVQRIDRTQIATSQDVRGSIGMIDEADFILTLSRPQPGELIISTDRFRRGYDFVTIWCDYVWNSYMIRERSTNFGKVVNDFHNVRPIGEEVTESLSV